MRKLLKNLLFTLFCLSFIFPQSLEAVENPNMVPNNLYGIHVHDENDLEDAAKLVNSQGGDWGYVTIVVRKDERNIQKWQNIFNKMRRLHLIPIVRIATKMDKDSWQKPAEEDIENWVYFLNSLNWVVKNRYVIVGNEPNHAKEWGGEVSPEEYARYLSNFTKKLKDASDEFFIIPAGFDASAPNGKETMDEGFFLVKMLAEVPNVFENIDGWASHSYPNPGFSGSENDGGRGSIRTFEWEKELLRGLGVSKELPFFITETGWLHNMDGKISLYHTPFSVGLRLKKAYENAWTKEGIVAVTPFILNYNTAPFENFSWKKPDGNFYEFYYEIQRIPKTKGEPVQKVSGEILTVITPEVIKRGDKFYGMAYVKNTGQSIWEPGTTTFLEDENVSIEIEPVSFTDLEPGQKGFIFFNGKVTEDNKSSLSTTIRLAVNEEPISLPMTIQAEYF